MLILCGYYMQKFDIDSFFGNIESQISIESNMTVSDAESVIKGSSASEKLNDIYSIETEPRESIFYKGVQWDASWIELLR